MKVVIAIAKGPFTFHTWRGRIVALTLVFAAVVLTQLGGFIAWAASGLIGIYSSNAARVFIVSMASVVLYIVCSIVIFPVVAKWANRIPLNCYSSTSNIQPQSLIYCLANRHYVTDELAVAIQELSATLHQRLPGRVIRYLDAGFPLGSGFPMLPHLSHGDGRRLDLMFLYTDNAGNPVKGNGLFLGYFSFVEPPESAVPQCQNTWLSLRWDFEWLQPLLSKPRFDVDGTRVLLETILENKRIQKVLLEPHLKKRLNNHSVKVRFQGCNAARHDDHMHIQF